MIVTGDSVRLWVSSKTGAPIVYGSKAIGVERDKEIKCGAVYEYYTGASISIHCYVEHPKYVTKRALFAMFDYPFNQLQVSKLIAQFPRSNKKVTNVLNKMSFRYETCIEHYFPDGDAVIYSMLREECPWLNILAKGEK